MKTVGNRTIEIRFQAREPFIDSEDEEDDKEGQEKEEKEEEGKEGGIKTMSDFEILVRDPSGKGLLFQCVTGDAQLNIERATYLNDVESPYVDSKFTDYIKAYKGPDFGTLDDKLREQFMHYLEFMGITDKVLMFIECAAVDKEQKLYMSWLENVKKFASEPQ